VVSFFFLSFFLFSSPNLSGRRLDVYHTSTHGVAQVRIWNVGLKRDARGSLEMQDPNVAKNSPSGHHRTTLSGYIFASKALIDNVEKPVKQQCLPHMYLQYGELRPTSGRDLLASLRHPCKFQRLSRLGSVTARHSSSGRQPNCGVEQRAPPIFNRPAITLDIGPHF